jgi:transcriptional/translational regulatory protein YebC/TACO1
MVEKILPLNKDEIEERAMELPIADIEIEDTTVVIYADKKDFTIVQDGLTKFNYHITEADIQFIPENMVTLDEENTNRLYTLLDALDEDEDVDHVWHNMGN